MISKNEDGKEYINEDGKERAQDELRFGHFDTSKAGTKGFELIPNFTATKINSIINYGKNKIDDRGSAAFFKSLYNSMISDKGGDVLIFIHGFNTDLGDAAKNIRELEEKYIFQESPIKHIVMFTWPAKSPNIPLHYRSDAKDADDTGDELYRAFKMLLQFMTEFFKKDITSGTIPKFCNRKIHLMCHSMGNRVLRAMLERTQEDIEPLESVFDQIILIAANINWDDLHEHNRMENIGELCSRTHVYFKKGDNALDIAKYSKNFANQLGKYGVKNLNKVDGNVFQVDVTKITDQEGFQEKLLDHWYYVNSKTVINDIVGVFIGDDVPSKIHSTFSKRETVASRSFQLKTLQIEP